MAGDHFAAAGLERLGITHRDTGPQLLLNWMLPSPAQGAIVVICRREDEDMLEACSAMHDEETAVCTMIERNFMRLMMGGCSTPISAYATVAEGVVNFHGNITAVDGQQAANVKITAALHEASQIATQAVEKMQEKGIEKYLYKI